MYTEEKKCKCKFLNGIHMRRASAIMRLALANSFDCYVAVCSTMHIKSEDGIIVVHSATRPQR